MKTMMLLSILLMAVFTVGCSAKSTVKEEKERKAITGKDHQINYIDSGIFDASFANLITNGANSVNIRFSGDVSMNQMPDRVKTWLDKSTAEGSILTMIDERDVESSRGAEDVLKAIYEYYKDYKASLKFEEAGRYDIDLIYNEDKGSIINILFKRRPDADEEE